MKLTLLLYLAVTIYFESCSQAVKHNSFEGIITYKIAFTPKSDNVKYIDYQKQKYGDQMKFYVSHNGNFKREYPRNGESGFEFVIYDATSNKTFAKWRNIDTTYSSSCATNSIEFVSENNLPSEVVYGQLCDSYFISGIEPKSGQTVSLTYYYPKNKEYINPDLYKNDKDIFYNQVIEKMKAPFYKLIMDMGKYSLTFEIDKIEPSNLDSKLFNIPTNVFVKENNKN